MTPQAITQVSVARQLSLMQVFLALQMLDFLTTMAGFRLGFSEANPFVRWLTELGPVAGLLLSKLVAVGIAGFCVWRQRFRTIRVVNYWCAGLVIWNLGLLILASRPWGPAAVH